MRCCPECGSFDMTPINPDGLFYCESCESYWQEDSTVECWDENPELQVYYKRSEINGSQHKEDPR